MRTLAEEKNNEGGRPSAKILEEKKNTEEKNNEGGRADLAANGIGLYL